MKSLHNSIGIFDSGVGGTSIWKEITTLLPNENTIYLSDSKNAPYGNKSSEEIINLSIKNTEYLLELNCKIIVVACNTATTNAIEVLRKKYNIPFVGIEPAIKPAALQTKTNKIGILATQGTLSSQLFEKTSKTISKDIIIREKIGYGLVELIESGQMYSTKITKLLNTYLKPLVQEKIDCLVLGCTHYPYLIPQIREIIGNNIKIIDSGRAVAKQTKAILEKHNLLKTENSIGFHQFYSNKNKKILEDLLVENLKNVSIIEQNF